MTRQEILDALLAERYGPPVRQVSRAGHGPTAEWQARRDRELAAALVEALGDEEEP